MTRKSLARRFGLLLMALAVLAAPPQLGGQTGRERVSVRAPRPYADEAAAVARAGGEVAHRSKRIDAVAANVPKAGLQQRRDALPAGSVSTGDVIWLHA